MSKTSVLSKQKTRLMSLDALRGFNMLWIIGAERIASSIAHLKIPWAAALVAQLSHTQWIGFTFYDLIYPMFIFVVGISIAFAMKRPKESGRNNYQTVGHILIRTALLLVLGIYMSNSGFSLHGWLHHQLRWMGVLQRIALCYFIASILVLYTKPKHQAVIAGGLLIGYWLMVRFIPVPGYGSAIWDPPEANLANYIDSRFLPGRLYYHTWDPEGLLSSLAAFATCLMGVLTGRWLKREERAGIGFSDNQKVAWLALAGLITAGIGIWWGLDFPIIKKIWTSSFTLLTGGISMIAMALFYWLIEIRNWRKWAFPLTVIGRNSIFIYIASSFIPFGIVSNWLVGGQIFAWLGDWQDLLRAILTLLLEWLLLYVMYWRKIFIKL